ncbi:MAG: dihydromonapterin reductase [Pseudomonadales bacterium]|nr:dihydromonapterin reductase [Pseudomonadales bacterium]
MKDIVLITGVAKRLGFAMAKRFLKAGVDVVGTYRSERDSLGELRAAGVELIQCDLSSQTDVDKLCESVKAQDQGIRAIIHNASDWMSESGSDDLWSCFDSMMAVHARAPYYINMSLESHLIDGADIIHIGDYVSSTGSAKHLAYAASKAALDNLTLSFAKRLAPKCKVNAIAPALILFNDGDSDSYKEKAVAKSLMGREGGVDEFLRMLDFIMASDYVTGRVLPLDGGRHLK